MKKLIFISLEDFLKAGGKTSKGMKVYREMPIKPMNPSDDNTMVEISACVGELKDAEPDPQSNCYIVKNDSFKSFPMAPLLLYVKIEVNVNV